ncbi:MAG: hypothetical protein M3Z27_04165 [Actinomycetota bacterium]|nr:hypothetical protein [Actinomycetota bacterium]
MLRRLAVGCVSATALALVAFPSVASADLTAVEGQSFSGTVSPSGGCAFQGASVDWGDGTTSDGGLTQDGTGFTGTHTYAEEGAYNGSVAYTCPLLSGTQHQPFTATVQDAAVTGAGRDSAGGAGQPLTAVVSHFDDANPAAGPDDFTAQIAWGDGTTSAGSVAAAAGGGFDVLGTHTYTTAGSYPVSTTITDTGGSSTSASSSAQIAQTALPPPSAALTTPPDGATYTRGEVVKASYSCSPGSGSALKPGVAGCSGPVASGASIDTATVGANTFVVIATDTDGQSATATTHYTVVGPPPPPPIHTTITSGPQNGSNAYAPPLGIPPRFTFVSSVPGSRFECNFHRFPPGSFGGPLVFTPCSSPYRPQNLVIGRTYTFTVRAIDPAGNVDPNPPSRFFRYRSGPVLRPPYGNFRIRGIDVFQVVQPNAGAAQFGFDPARPFVNYAGGGTPTNWRYGRRGYRLVSSDPQQVPYAGVTLDPDKQTTAIVYVDFQDQPAEDRGPTLDVTLEMKRASGSIVFTRTVTLPAPWALVGTSTTPWVTASERGQRSYGVQIPIASPRAVKPDVRFDLHATVRFTPGTTGILTHECDNRDCSADNHFILRGVASTPADGPGSYGELKIAALQLVRGAQQLPSPERALERTRELFPNFSGTAPGPYRDRIDITAATDLTASDDPKSKDPKVPSFSCNNLPYDSPKTKIDAGKEVPISTADRRKDATRQCRLDAVGVLVDDWSKRNPARLVESDRIRRMYDVIVGIEDYTFAAGEQEPGVTSDNVTTVGPSTPAGTAPRAIFNGNTRPISAAAHEFGHLMSAAARRLRYEGLQRQRRAVASGLSRAAAGHEVRPLRLDRRAVRRWGREDRAL